MAPATLNRHDQEPSRERRKTSEDIDEASAQSMDASDPPSFSPTTAGAGRSRRSTGASQPTREQRTREKAYQLWIEEGRPDGRDEAHWQMAEELVAIEDNQRFATKPNPMADGSGEAARGELVEPIEAVESLGDLPGKTDQGERPDYPKRRTRRKTH